MVTGATTAMCMLISFLTAGGAAMGMNNCLAQFATEVENNRRQRWLINRSSKDFVLEIRKCTDGLPGSILRKMLVQADQARLNVSSMLIQENEMIIFVTSSKALNLHIQGSKSPHAKLINGW